MYRYGASGHGKVSKEIIEVQGGNVEDFVDDNQKVTQIAGLPVLHDAGGLSTFITSIGSNKNRKRISERMECEFGIAIHPRAIVSPSAKIGAGTVVMAGAIINANAEIGRHCIINTGSSIDHDCLIGNYCHIALCATLCGQVTVGEGRLVGASTSVIPCTIIGAWCVIGAGSAVIEDIDDIVTAVGNPATVIRVFDFGDFQVVIFMPHIGGCRYAA